MSTKDIGQRIKRLREEKNISQQELAEHLGYNGNSVISKIENGTSEMTVGQVKLIAEYFGVTLEYLATGTSAEVIKKEKEPASEITKQVGVIKDFNRLGIGHYIYFGLILVGLIISAILKNKAQTYGFASTIIALIINLSLLLILTRNDERKSIEIINLPVNRTVKYYNKLHPTIVKRYKKDRVLINVLMMVMDFILFAILITILNSLENSTTLVVVATIISIIIIGTKIVFTIIPRKGEIINYSKYLIVLLAIQTIFVAFIVSIINMDSKLIGTDVLILAIFNIFIFIFTILTNNYMLGKYYYELE